MQTLYETIKAIVYDSLHQLRTADLAVVQDVHVGNDQHSCTVVLRDTQIVLEKVPVAVARLGMSALPPVGSLVMVQYIDGDPNAPIITGNLYDDTNVPQSTVNADTVMLHLPFDSDDSSAIHMAAESGQNLKCTLKVGNAAEITVVDDDPVVTISINSGNAEIKIGKDGSCSVTCANNLTLESKAQLELKGATGVSISSDANVKVKGQMIQLN